MKFCEIIHLRVSGMVSDRLMSTFTNLIEDIQKKEDCERVMLYKHAVIGTDICIHLLHESDKIELTGSPIGLRLTETLKDYGMTSHTVWVSTV